MIADFYIFFIGLFFGSFFNVVIDRMARGEQFWKGRSHCDHCQHPLAWYDLIPLFSFLLLNGKCRYCHKGLSLYYPVLELVTGAIFALTYVLLPDKSLPNIAYMLFLVSSLIIIFFADLKYTIIPFMIVIPMCIIVYLHTFVFFPMLFFSILLSAIGATVFFLLLFFITKGKGMGFGDVVYAFFMGSILGYPGIIMGLYIAFISGAVIGVLYLVLKRKKLRGAMIPFGPFLVIGTYIALFFSATVSFSLLAIFPWFVLTGLNKKYKHVSLSKDL